MGTEHAFLASIKEQPDIGAEGAAALAASPHLANLAVLNLHDNGIAPEAAAQLRQRYGARCWC